MIPETIAVEAPEALNAIDTLAVPPIPVNLVWLLFLVAFLVLAVYSAILVYHWFEYEVRSALLWPTMFIYFGVSALFILILFFAAVSIT